MKIQYCARSTHIAARELDGEMIVMSAVNSTLFTLNEVATAIWNAADGVTPLNEIIERRVCADYGISAELVEREVGEFVHELASHGILLISDHPIPVEDRKLHTRMNEPSKAKKDYKKPSFLFERVFETMALLCGKVGSQGQCRVNRKFS